ncbi:MAG TPA: glycosyltransferase [Chitinophagales bacterium]|nr:glycosyltransferase [Chitinophagales bacterium]
MKIIFIGSAHPFRGGLATFNERLSRELIAMGHEVEIYTFTVQYPSFLFPGKSQFTDAPAPADLKISRRVNSINPLNWILVGNEIRKKKPDLLLYKFWLPLMGPCFGTIARRSKKNHHTRVISILDNVIPHEKRTGDVAFTKYFLTACDGFVTMSDSVSVDLKKFVPRKPFIQNPHPLYDNFGAAITMEEAQKQLSLDPGFHYLLFFGFIRKYKGLDLLLEAFADEQLRKFPLKLIVAGEFYENSKPYLDLISKLNLQSHVILKTDFIAEEEVKKYFSAADVVVQPYRSATQSGVTQIAYQFNKPMIVTNVGGLPELVPDGKVGLCVDPTPKAIADAILNFFENNLSKNFEAGIPEEKKRFSWRSFAENLLTLIGKSEKL